MLKIKPIKPCPFCGGEAVMRVHLGKTYICPIHRRSCAFHPDTWIISKYPIEKQIKIWNRRYDSK